jgi:hypothetical protein
MKSIFETAAREEITRRINSLTPQHSAHWGKMNVYQMLVHGAKSDDMMHGAVVIPRVFIGRIIGKMILRKSLKDQQPFGKNSPTSPVLKTHSIAPGDFEKARTEWLSRVEKYSDFKNTAFVHPFFGPMTKEQIGWFVYKHADHHLRQFGV